MNRLHFHNYRLTFRPLSPVHIGSDLAVDPCEYDLIEQDGNEFLVVADMPRLLAHLPTSDRDELDKLLQRANFTGIRRWLHEHLAHDRRFLRFAVQVKADAADEIRRNLDNPKRLGEIQLMTRHPASGIPYIPGSSIKGAVRTALLDALIPDAEKLRKQQLENAAKRARREPQKIKHAVAFECQVLGHFESDGKTNLYRDPFRQLAFSDICLSPTATYIDRIRIIRRPDHSRRSPGSPDPGGIVMYRELTWSFLDGEPLDGIAYSGQCRLFPALTDPEKMKPDRKGQPTVLPRTFDIHTLCKACNDFYRPRLEEEIENFHHVNRTVSDDQEESNAKILQKALAGLSDTTCLIRLGRHSHFECVTVGPDYHQPPRRGYGKTRSYAAGLLPLGWALLDFKKLDNEVPQR